MPLAFHAVALNPIIRGLHNLTPILQKAEAHALATGVDPQTYIDARLAPDMAPFTSQIYYLTNTAISTVSRITQIPELELPNTETTFPALQARIAKTIAYLEAVDASAFEGVEDEEVVIRTGKSLPVSSEIRFVATDYVAYFAHPNFWFHHVAAYAILRNQGVDLGKIDFVNGAGLVESTVVSKEYDV